MKLDDIFEEGKTYVGIDPSRTSTGLVIVSGGGVESYCIYPDVKRTGVMAGVEDKEALKRDIESILTGRDVDVCVVEKVFFGGYINSFVHLVEIMNMMEELILEGRVSVKKLIRVQNTTWKSWIRPWRTKENRKLQGNQGKDIVNDCLNNMGLLGYITDGRGWQDRVDALGMLVGYCIESRNGKRTVKLHDSRICIDLLGETEWEEELQSGTKEVEGKITLARMKRELARNEGRAVVSREKISLGFEELHSNITRRGVEAHGKGHIKLWYNGDIEGYYDEWNA